MKVAIFLFLMLFASLNCWAEGCGDSKYDCPNTFKLLKPACKRLHQIWYDGKAELQIPAYAWHNRFYYSNHRTYNENPWGGGLGKSYYDEHGDWHGLYAFAFLDSHKNVEPIAGYGFEKMWHFNEKTGVGAGYTVFVTSRPDIIHSIPFPGILPLVAISHQRATLMMIYVPGQENIGNVLFVLVKWVLN
jgi:palmitoyl transferase